MSSHLGKIKFQDPQKKSEWEKFKEYMTFYKQNITKQINNELVIAEKNGPKDISRPQRFEIIKYNGLFNAYLAKAPTLLHCGLTLKMLLRACYASSRARWKMMSLQKCNHCKHLGHVEPDCRAMYCKLLKKIGYL